MSSVAPAHTSLAPVQYPAPFAATDAQGPEEGVGLCLSGGGYRAMLFHLGTLWRLNELGILPTLKRISSVSGGSITSGALAVKWDQLNWQNGVAMDFVDEVVAPIRALASTTIDIEAVVAGALLPGVSISDKVVRAYEKHLFGDATLQDIPDEMKGAPRFIFNATNLQSGVLWRFARPFMADYRVGRVDNPTVPLAFAVAASSAFPPILSPARMQLAEGDVQPTEGVDLHQAPYTTDVFLTDGGVYDNLGLETVWKRYTTVLVSDGGGHYAAEPKPHSDWLRYSIRVADLIDSQVRALRTKQLVESFRAGTRKGAYVRMRGDISEYHAPRTLPCPLEATMQLAATPTRLSAIEPVIQERIINWGYAMCDAAVRTYVSSDHSPPSGFPYPAAGVG